MNIKNLSTVAVSLVLACLSPSIHAENDPLQLNPASPWYRLNADSGWHFDLGVGIEFEPAYAGSDVYSTEPDAFARALYRTEGGHRYFLSLGEVGAIFALSDTLQFQAFLEYEEEREVDDDDVLRDLDPIDATIEGQFMLARRFGRLSTYVILQPDLTGDANKGLVWFVGAGYDWLSDDKRWRFGTTFDVSGADSEYMNTEFGITAAEALRTGYRQYQPGSGLKSASFGLNAEYFFSPRLSLLTNVETEYYFGDAADSPLIADFGRDVGVEASVLLRWTF